MLYLNIFLQVLVKNPFKALMFFITGTGLCLLLGQGDRLHEKAMKTLPKMGKAPHFFALIEDKVNPEGVRRKLMDLPGVSSVRNIPGVELEKQLAEVLGDVGIDEAPGLEVPNVAGIKVFFSPKLEVRSQKLIKKYLTRLVGKEKVTIGPTVGEAKETSAWNAAFKDSFKLKFGTSLLALCGILYLVFGFMLSTQVSRESYLIERFSRRRNVAHVASGIGFLFAAGLMTAPAFFLKEPNVLGIGVFLSLILAFYLFTVKRGWGEA